MNAKVTSQFWPKDSNYMGKSKTDPFDIQVKLSLVVGVAHPFVDLVTGEAKKGI